MGVVALRDWEGCVTFTGNEGEVRAHLTNLVAAGQLVPDGLLGQGRMPDGRCYARVQLLDAEPRRRVRRGLVVAAALAATAVLGVIAWGVVLVVSWVLAHLVQLVVATVVVLLICCWLLSKSGGKHCPGCN
jgi:hypothetical protein